MYDTNKVALVKKLIIVGLALLVLFTGTGIGYTIGTKGKTDAIKAAKAENKKKPDKDEKNNLKLEDIDRFLIAYYTKKDLGENQNRYKPFMTLSMFNQTVSLEETPINQAYKGYVVNQVFQKSIIYIDNVNLEAICVVDYKNTQRTKFDNDEGALKNQSNKETIKISFQKAGKKYLVNKIDYATLDMPYVEGDKNSYDRLEKNTKSNSGDDE